MDFVVKELSKMGYLVKITGFYPKEYCYQCMFCRINEYGESRCMLHELNIIDSPNYDRPEWCPFNEAKEENN